MDELLERELSALDSTCHCPRVVALGAAQNAEDWKVLAEKLDLRVTPRFSGGDSMNGMVLTCRQVTELFDVVDLARALKRAVQGVEQEGEERSHESDLSGLKTLAGVKRHLGEEARNIARYCLRGVAMSKRLEKSLQRLTVSP